jgi:hypothetical protein
VHPDGQAGILSGLEKSLARLSVMMASSFPASSPLAAPSPADEPAGRGKEGRLIQYLHFLRLSAAFALIAFPNVGTFRKICHSHPASRFLFSRFDRDVMPSCRIYGRPKFSRTKNAERGIDLCFTHFDSRVSFPLRISRAFSCIFICAFVIY